MNKNPLIVALDLDSADAARGLVQSLGDAVRFYKVGLELYAAAGPQFVRELVSEGCEVFLDLKLYDIGETVKRATAQVAKLGVRFLTVHAVPQVMKAAMEGKAGLPVQILGVTVLTSLDQLDLSADGHSHSVEDLVALRVRNGVAAGVDGIVCSPLEVAKVRAIAGPSLVLVVPGVRSAGADAGDQKRVATPRQAVLDGANYLVIGRQVTRSEDPRREAQRILEEVQA